MHYDNDWAVIVPMANEEHDFNPFATALTTILNRLKGGTVYFVVDNASHDNTLAAVYEGLLSESDNDLDHRSDHLSMQAG
jgi:dolichol-phosphate mannosyltransferase